MSHRAQKRAAHRKGGHLVIGRDMVGKWTLSEEQEGGFLRRLSVHDSRAGARGKRAQRIADECTHAAKVLYYAEMTVSGQPAFEHLPSATQDEYRRRVQAIVGTFV